MCGIIGFISDKPEEYNYSTLGDLLYLSASRGTDATGIAVVKSEQVKVVKEEIASDKFIKKHYTNLKKEVVKAKIVLGHTRLATQGHQKDNNNNHPVVGGKYVMVHNGTCSSMARIKDYSYKGTVDSEILLSHIERNGFRDGLKALKGSAAVAIVSADEPNVVYIWRHNNPLWLAYSESRKTLFFASTEDILREGLADVLDFFSSYFIRQIPEDVLYKITCNPLRIEAIEDIEPEGYSYSYWKGGKNKNNPPYYPLAGHNSYYGEYDWESYGCDGEDTSAKDRVLTPLNSDVPKEDTQGACNFMGFYKDVVSCVWDVKKKIYTTDRTDNEDLSLRYYFAGASQDFTHWNRLEGGGHVSLDKKLVKFFDHNKQAHFVMLVTDAIKEGLIDLSR